MGLRDVATCFDSSFALISCAISKHSSSSEEHMACEAGTVPPGPRKFPSTRVLKEKKIKMQVSFRNRADVLRRETMATDLGMGTQRIDLAELLLDWFKLGFM
jgi:hypothetical protein